METHNRALKLEIKLLEDENDYLNVTVNNLKEEIRELKKEISTLKQSNEVYKGLYKREKYISDNKPVLHNTDITKIKTVKREIDALMDSIEFRVQCILDKNGVDEDENESEQADN